MRKQKAKQAADGMKAEVGNFKEGGESAKEAQTAAQTFDEEEDNANKEADKVTQARRKRTSLNRCRSSSSGSQTPP